MMRTPKYFSYMRHNKVVTNSRSHIGSGFFISRERSLVIAIMYVDGQRVMNGPYSNQYRGNKVSQELVAQVPDGYLDFFVKEKSSKRWIRKRLKKEEFRKRSDCKVNQRVPQIPNRDKDFTDDKRKNKP